MKKIILSALMLASMMVSVNAQKIGYCNSKAILAEMPEMVVATSELGSLKMQLQNEGEAILAILQTEYNAAQKIISGGCITEREHERLRKQLREKGQQITLFEQEIPLKIQKREAELHQPILQKLNDAIAEVAKENGYQIIFDKGSQRILFAEQSTDINIEVKAKLGL